METDAIKQRPTFKSRSALTLPWATDWAAEFGRRAPLILEIGFGSGRFLLHLARTFPDHNVIGVEIASRSLTEAERRIVRDGLPNICAVHAPAETALHHLFEPASLAQIHINFPDPWFKTSHHKRRLMQRDTLDTMVSRLAPGGLLYLATDIADYAEMSAALLADTPGLTNRLPSAWADAVAGRSVTKYEAAAQQAGRACYYFAYQRNSTPAPDVPVQKDLAMPHITYRSPLPLDAVVAQFAPIQQRDDDGIVVHLLEAYRGRNALLFETFVREPTIEQHVALLLVARPGGEYTLRLSSLGHARPTPGVHRAVALLGAWLVGLHPEGQVVVDKTVSGEDAQKTDA